MDGKKIRNSSADFSQKLSKYIKIHEGLRLKPYYCPAGKLSIGYGRNLEGRGITKAEAEILLSHDISMALQDLYSVFGCQTYEWSDSRYMALADIMFNLGLPTFRQFKKMIEAIRQGDWFRASKELMDSKYARQNKVRATRNAILLKEDGQDAETT